MENSNQINQKIKRPTWITILCILGFISIPFSLLGILWPEVRNQIIQQYGNLVILNVIVSSILGAVGFVGLWKMKKWGLYFYTAMVIFGFIFSLYQGISFNLGYIISPIIAIAAWMNIKKMR